MHWTGCYDRLCQIHMSSEDGTIVAREGKANCYPLRRRGKPTRIIMGEVQYDKWKRWEIRTLATGIETDGSLRDI